MISPIPVLVGLALCFAATPLQGQRIAPAAATRAPRHELVSPPRILAGVSGQPMSAWLKWGLVGAGVGAVAYPLIGSLASVPDHQPARDVAIGAASGFVIVGGSVALWRALCGPDSASRRAGMCGR